MKYVKISNTIQSPLDNNNNFPFLMVEVQNFKYTRQQHRSNKQQMSTTEVKKPTEATTTAAACDQTTTPIIKAPLFFSMPKVLATYTVGKVQLRELEGIQTCKGAALIDGIPNAQSDGMLTNIITVNYIVQQLKLPLVNKYQQHVTHFLGWIDYKSLFFPLVIGKMWCTSTWNTHLWKCQIDCHC